MQAQIRFRKLKEGFEEQIQELREELEVLGEELREELELLHVQTNNRLFFGTTHSVSRYVTKLTSASLLPPYNYCPSPKLVAGMWSGDTFPVQNGRVKWTAQSSIQDPEELFTLSDSDCVVIVKEVNRTS